MLSLSEQNLNSGRLKQERDKLHKEFYGYNATLIIIRSNFGKEFAFFIPCKM